jgi:arginine deiminase
MHRPGDEIRTVTNTNAQFFGFESAVNLDKFQSQYDQFLKALRSCKVEPVLIGEVLKDDKEAQAYIAKRPNVMYTRDLSMMIGKGLVLMSMQAKGRKWDTWLVRRVAEKLHIPVLGEIAPDGILEGGGVEFITDRTLAVGFCDRANEVAFAKMKQFVLGKYVDELAVVMMPEGIVHIDGLFLPVDKNVVIANKEYLNNYPCVVYGKSKKPRYTWFIDYLEARGIDIIAISYEEGMKGAANYIQVGPCKLVGYEGNDRVEREVRKRGGDVITFPGGELIKGKGGPHCMTCPLDRAR